ncbi:MAG: PadR family transcriptional regulator [Candidatus Bathyarchaeia archaeon]|nr:PadR family transcriptional regulator [Candidatus Bathyarchaeota archaeon]
MCIDPHIHPKHPHGCEHRLPHPHHPPIHLGPIRGLLHIAILKLVKEKSMHGSEIHSLLKEKYNLDVPKPLVYGLLRKLEAHGLLHSRWETDDGGPAKRIYTITDEGIEYLEHMLKKIEKVKTIIDRLIG